MKMPSPADTTCVGKSRRKKRCGNAALHGSVLCAKCLIKRTAHSIVLLHGADPRELERLASSEQAAGVHLRVAGHPQTPVDALIRLAASDDHAVITAAINNPNARCVKMVKALQATSDSEQYRLKLVEQPRLPQQVVDALLEDDCDDVVTDTIRAQSVSSQQLEHLAEHPSLSVRHAVITRPHVPPTAVAKAMRHASSRDIRMMLSSQQIAGEVLDALADEWLVHGQSPGWSPTEFDNTSNNPSEAADFLLTIAQHPQAQADTLQKIVERVSEWSTVDYKWNIRFAVAENQGTNSETLRHLQRLYSERRQAHEPMDAALLRHSSCTSAIQTAVLEKYSSKLRPKRLLNPSVAESVETMPHMSAAAMNVIAKGDNNNLQTALARRSDLPQSVALKLATDGTTYCKTALAENQHSTAQTLVALVNDPKTFYSAIRTALDHPNLPVSELTAIALRNDVMSNMAAQKLSALRRGETGPLDYNEDSFYDDAPF